MLVPISIFFFIYSKLQFTMLWKQTRLLIFFILPRSINYNTKEFECTLRSEMNYMDSNLFKCFAWIDGLVFQELHTTSEFSTKHSYDLEKSSNNTVTFQCYKNFISLWLKLHISCSQAHFLTRVIQVAVRATKNSKT